MKYICFCKSLDPLCCFSGPSPDFLRELINNSKKIGSSSGGGVSGNNCTELGGSSGILEKLMLLRRKQQTTNDENEDRINSAAGGTEEAANKSKSLPASPLNKPGFESQQELLLAAARTAVANAAARYAAGPAVPLPPVPMFSNLPLPPPSVKDENGSPVGGAAAGGAAGDAGKNGGNPPGHGTSAGFCNICHKFVSNRTNHKYVHSQVRHIAMQYAVHYSQGKKFEEVLEALKTNVYLPIVLGQV